MRIIIKLSFVLGKIHPYKSIQTLLLLNSSKQLGKDCVSFYKGNMMLKMKQSQEELSQHVVMQGWNILRRKTKEWLVKILQMNSLCLRLQFSGFLYKNYSRRKYSSKGFPTCLLLFRRWKDAKSGHCSAGRLWLQILKHSSLFSRSSTVWLFLAPRDEINAQEISIRVKWRHHTCNYWCYKMPGQRAIWRRIWSRATPDTEVWGEW